MVYATCLKVTRDPHDAEDATQATFLTLASKSRLNGEIRQPEAWLRKVAHRLSLDLIRSKKRRINRENLRSEMTSEEAPLDSSDHAGNGELKGILNEELAKLPASYRMPLVLHYFGGLSREEMADQLKLKPSTLGVRLHRAREQLRKRLSSRGIALPSVALTALLTEIVRSSVCDHLLTTTAHQASAIALGQASAPVFSAGPGVHSLRLVTDLISGSKLRVLLSTLVLGSAISFTSASVQQFLPKIIRDLIPSFRAPSLPKIEFKVPAPRLVADASSQADADYAFLATSAATSAMLPERPQSVPSRAESGSILSVARSGTVGKVEPLQPVISPVNLELPQPRIAAPTFEYAVATSPSIGSRNGWSSPTLSTSTSPSKVTGNEQTPTRPVGGAGSAPNSDPWNAVIADGKTESSSTPAMPMVEASGEPAPEAVTSAVVGSVPEPGGSHGGGRTASVSSNAATPGSVTPLPAKTAIASRTATFSGTATNYGGFSDASWAAARVVDLSNSLAHTDVSQTSFSAPTVPGETDSLSLNGARVTLRNASGDDPASISFVDTASTQIPTLPAKHHFIGVWELDTLSSFESIDLLVRYDDLRAARMGLSEQILKLWVSDGETWTLMWNDPSFGRDIYQNLLWVTAGDDVKFFAVSAPEPATLTMLVAAAGLGLRRTRR